MGTSVDLEARIQAVCNALASEATPVQPCDLVANEGEMIDASTVESIRAGLRAAGLA